MKITTLFRISIALMLFVALTTVLYVFNIYVEIAVKNLVSPGLSREVLVERGVKLRKFSNQLYLKGVISSPMHFTVAYISQHPSKTLQAGLYLLSDKDTLLDLVEMVAKGRSIMESQAIIEGWDWRQLQRSLRHEKRFRISRESDILVQLNRERSASIWGMKLMHVEGLLMPDTYKFRRGVSDMEIIVDAFKRQSDFMRDQWMNRDKQAGYRTPYEALIVASLIEKESRYPNEYSKIAAVILNRIKKKMPIQIDASILYGLGRHQSRVTYRDLKKDTPYNTYLHRGLPPTPISMPSKRAIHAALHPYKFDALFYVLDSNKKNQHIFTNNFESHLKAKYNNTKR